MHVDYTASVEALINLAGDGPLAHRPTRGDPGVSIRRELNYAAALPAFTPRRLRATWLRDALNAAVPLAAVLAAAGVGSLDFNAIRDSIIDDDPDVHLAAIATHMATANPDTLGLHLLAA